MAEASGFFSAPRAALHALVDNSASSKIIAGYLILARFTDKSGCYSSAGKSAISRYSGISPGAAGEVVEALKKMEATVDEVAGENEIKPNRLLLDIKNWESINHRKDVKWVVNDFGVASDKKVWFPNSLVDGIDNFSLPLGHLIKCRNDALMRALILLYSEQDEAQVGGVRPFATMYFPYTTGKDIETEALTVTEAETTERMVFNEVFAKRVLGAMMANEGSLRAIIERLEREGYIYRAITVFDADPNLAETEALFTLDTKTTTRSPIQQSDDTLAEEMQQFAAPIGITCSDKLGRFYGKYAVVVPSGNPVHVAEHIRMRLRITDVPEFMLERLERVAEKHREAREWLTGDSGRLDEPETLLPQGQFEEKEQPNLSEGNVSDWASDIIFDGPNTLLDDTKEQDFLKELHATLSRNEKVPSICMDNYDDITFD